MYDVTNINQSFILKSAVRESVTRDTTRAEFMSRNFLTERDC